MDELYQVSVAHRTSIHNSHDARQPTMSPPDDAVFDATQYTFFGKDFVEEELGGLEETEERPLVLHDEDLYAKEIMGDEPHSSEVIFGVGFTENSSANVDGEIWPTSTATPRHRLNPNGDQQQRQLECAFNPSFHTPSHLYNAGTVADMSSPLCRSGGQGRNSGVFTDRNFLQQQQMRTLLLLQRQAMLCHSRPDPGVETGWREGSEKRGSKYMSAYEIEMIPKLQQASCLITDPYVDDYYFQAKNGGRRFFPLYLKSGDLRARPSSEPHPFLALEGLGRVTFSSVRRPRALIEVDTISGAAAAAPAGRSLEEEPVLVLVSLIEDGFCVLIDVDDIDRFLQFNRLLDGGAELRRRSVAMLDGIASTLQLMGRNGDRVFLRLASIPKGRKFVAAYLRRLLLHAGRSHLMGVVCTAAFRHLRALFSAAPEDMTEAVASCVRVMDLPAISACLAAALLSPPPFHHLSASTLLLRSLLQRATELANPPRTDSCWVAAFDHFFGLLTHYCFTKYSSAVIDAAAAPAIAMEMPVDLLRASLPHTSQRQRNQLLNFTFTQS